MDCAPIITAFANDETNLPTLFCFFVCLFVNQLSARSCCLRPPTALAGNSHLLSPASPLWVDVESSLKNSTSHAFVFPHTGH